MHRLLVNTAGRPAQLGCFGLHEWAMVYGLDADRVRHAGWPLRLPAAQTARVVAERGVRCSHLDAFRRWGICQRHEADNRGPNR